MYCALQNFVFCLSLSKVESRILTQIPRSKVVCLLGQNLPLESGRWSQKHGPQKAIFRLLFRLGLNLKYSQSK